MYHVNWSSSMAIIKVWLLDFTTVTRLIQFVPLLVANVLYYTSKCTKLTLLLHTRVTLQICTNAAQLTKLYSFAKLNPLKKCGFILTISL